jgi:hypothetical protein
MSPVPGLLAPSFSYQATGTGWLIHSDHPLADLDQSILTMAATATPNVATCEPDVMQRRHVLVVELESPDPDPWEALGQLVKQLESFYASAEGPPPVIGTAWQTWRPGLTVRRHHAERGLFHVRCPVPLAYVGNQKLREVCLAIQGVDRIGPDYFEPDVLEVVVAERHLPQADSVLAGVLAALARMFPPEGCLPAHSPLHHAALTLADVGVGMRIARHTLGQGCILEATITDIITSADGLTTVQLDGYRLASAAHMGLEPYVVGTTQGCWDQDTYILKL